MKKDVFLKFSNKYILKGQLLVLTALHIGSGEEGQDNDAPFIKTSKEGQYYVPGSSFRGYLRTKLERFLYEDNNFKLKAKGNNKTLNLDTVKEIFGYTDGENNSSLAGRIHVQDMKLLTDNGNENENMQTITTVTRDGIKIDKDTGIVESGGKFDYDVITLGNIFDFRIELENVEKYEFDLIMLALNDILSKDGDLIGGKTSRGIGRCRVENLEIDYVDSNDKEALKEYIFSNKLKKLEDHSITDLMIGD